jgi:DNA-binding MarR family transcriptional regulator
MPRDDVPDMPEGTSEAWPTAGEARSTAEAAQTRAAVRGPGQAGPAAGEAGPEPDKLAGWSSGAGTDAERQQLENDFLLALRQAGSIMQLLGQVSAERIGINATDLNCLNLVALTGHMTAGDLAKATGLTTASITGVLDRLEEGGFVRRERDPHDRRRVIVNLSAGPGLRLIGPVFAPLVKAWRAAAADYSDDELRLLLDFQRRLEEIMRGQLARLRGEGGAQGQRELSWIVTPFRTR